MRNSRILGPAKRFVAGLDVGRPRTRGAEVCGLNNGEDELPLRG